MYSIKNRFTYEERDILNDTIMNQSMGKKEILISLNFQMELNRGFEMHCEILERLIKTIQKLTDEEIKDLVSLVPLFVGYCTEPEEEEPSEDEYQ